jgi:hypothetical protein
MGYKRLSWDRESVGKRRNEETKKRRKEKEKGKGKWYQWEILL